MKDLSAPQAVTRLWIHMSIHNLDQKKLAGLAGVSREHVNRVLNGKCEMGTKLACYLGLERKLKYEVRE